MRAVPRPSKSSWIDELLEDEELIMLPLAAFQALARDGLRMLDE